MGCCLSSPTASPYPTQQPSSSSRAITSSQPQSHSALPRPSTHNSSHSNRPHQHTPQPLSEPINRPLKPHVWVSNDRVWSREDIDRERTEFFDTRVTGRPEIWQTIHAALEVLWMGGDPLEDDGGMATAQQILDAAGITIPTGDPANGAYDSFGAFYALPGQIVSDPANLVNSSVEEESGNVDKLEGDEADEGEEEILRRREEKGKAVLNPRDVICVKARLSDGGGPDLVISFGKADSVRLLVRKIFEESGLSLPKHIKIAYLGKILKENQSLLAQGWKEGHVINALVFG